MSPRISTEICGGFFTAGVAAGVDTSPATKALEPSGVCPVRETLNRRQSEAEKALIDAHGKEVIVIPLADPLYTFYVRAGPRVLLKNTFELLE